MMRVGGAEQSIVDTWQGY